MPAGAGGAGDVEPGVLAGERDGRGRGLHGHLRPGPGPALELRRAFFMACRLCKRAPPRPGGRVHALCGLCPGHGGRGPFSFWLLF